MIVIEIEKPGGPEVLKVVDRQRPRPGPGEVLVRVIASGVNRPDVQQRRGLYPPPPGASDIPGLDVAGIVEEVGEGVETLQVGTPICALVNGGGYAEFCLAPAVQCMPIPRGLSFIEGASLPEVFFTAWNNLIWLARVTEGETLLIQGGASGVGMAGIQIARHLRRAIVFATAGTPQKREICLSVGATTAFDYRGAWDDDIRDQTRGLGVDVVLDGQAGPRTQRQLDLLKPDGRLVFIASHDGETAEVNIRSLVRRRLTITGSTLRPRPAEYKGRLARELIAQVWPLIEDGRIKTYIHQAVEFHQVRDAHAILDDNRQIGKVVLVVDPTMAATVPEPLPALQLT
ncbi:NAD(P)H-quinone oxidoreductase (plasmid) [Neorhizobium sp. SOG26]|uniref:NAD(P)H-quinone oxidoreductase n=1 Tax=Neorhizobium sp. SOG26 TaxID=2060726 RepID=UPI000E58C7B9|nr:NAD(P)H-quinone oxidoreductase [Neorhizobium sp. SOG26]AXV17906.1 NAD(P)H-quinone oxidoreductase [Neorhizobium sp. SOG26]